MDKYFMLLKPLPFHNKGTINTKRFWINSLVTDEEGFEKLIKQGWFK